MCDSKDLTKALYRISNLLDPNIKAYSNDELIKQAIAILSEDCCFAVHTTKAKNSSWAMTQQLDKLNACLVVDLTNFVCYCIDLDSTKDAADTKQLPICVIGVMLDFNIYEDFNKIILRVPHKFWRSMSWSIKAFFFIVEASLFNPLLGRTRSGVDQSFNFIYLFMSRHEVHSMNTHTLQNAGS